MYNMKVCPMMQQSNMQMPNMMIDDMYDMLNNPINNMPIFDMYEEPNEPCEAEMMKNEKSEMHILEKNEKDENHYLEMMPEYCKKIMHHIDRVLDNLEDKDESMYEKHYEKTMVKDMVEEAYKGISKEMPDLMHGYSTERQYGPGGFIRDIAGILLVNELLRRRRRRRYFDYGYDYGTPYYGTPYYGRSDYEGEPNITEYYESINYEDYYVNDMD